MRSILQLGGSLETSFGDDSVRHSLRSCFWRGRKRHNTGTRALRAKGLCGVHDNRSRACLDTLLHPLSSGVFADLAHGIN